MTLAGVLLKLGGYGLIRFGPLIFPLENFYKSIIISSSLLGASFTRIRCIRQKDIKALIAYSSVAHIGLVIASILIFKHTRNHAAIILIVSHGLTSSALFLLVTILYQNNHSRNIIIFKGLLSFLPNITFW